jgi:hypothetical protein
MQTIPYVNRYLPLLCHCGIPQLLSEFLSVGRGMAVCPHLCIKMCINSAFIHECFLARAVGVYPLNFEVESDAGEFECFLSWWSVQAVGLLLM